MTRAEQLARKVAKSPAQVKAIACRVIGTAETRMATCCALCKMGLYDYAGGGDYCGQTGGGKSRYNERTFRRTDLGAKVAAILEARAAQEDPGKP